MAPELKPAKPVLPAAENVPQELVSLNRWVAWQPVYDDSKKKWKKPPYSPVDGSAIGATYKYASHFLPFASALQGVEKHNLHGVGFVFAEADGYVGIDFDDCVKEGVVHPDVQNWLRWFSQAYIELSPSGTGLHIICRGRIAKALTAKRLPTAPDVTVEVYSTGRYFTWTGQRVGGSVTIGDCQESLSKLLEHVGEKDVEERPPQQEETNSEKPMSIDSARRIYASCLEKLRNAKQGEGNAKLNEAAYFAGRAFKAGAFDETENAIKRELLAIVTKEWEKPHPEDTARGTIMSGWSSGIAQPLKLFTESLVIRCLDDVQEQPIEWLWPNRIPMSAVTAFSGNPDTGKTMAYCDLVARVTTSRDFPDAKMPSGVAGDVIMLCSEDDYARVIKPRLIAAGADTKSVFFIEKVEIRQGARRDERLFALDTDLSKLEEELEKGLPYSLIVIDPISSYFGKGNMNSKQDVRTVFNRLTRMCERNRVTTLIVEHFSKRVDVGAIHKLGGSVALTAAVRAAFMFAKVPDEDGQNVMHFIKGNFAKRKTGLRFTFGDKELASLGVDPDTNAPYRVPYIVWGSEDQGTADELLRSEKGASEDNRAARAARFLEEFLTEEKPQEDVEAEAKKRNISRSALCEAKKELRVISNRPRKGKEYWSWVLPKRPEPGASRQENQDSIPF